MKKIVISILCWCMLPFTSQAIAADLYRAVVRLEILEGTIYETIDPSTAKGISQMQCKKALASWRKKNKAYVQKRMRSLKVIGRDATEQSVCEKIQ